ncbi:hypothetical protein FGRMN_9679 [Fusarium graminum]|nr:hypothetical protein FGRMN_9679 [Fusarium graminum]
MDTVLAPFPQMRVYYNDLTPFQTTYLAFALIVFALHVVLIALRRFISRQRTHTPEEILRRLRSENLIELPPNTTTRVSFESSQEDHKHFDSPSALFNSAMFFAISTLFMVRVFLYIYPEWREAPPMYFNFITLLGFSVGHLAAFTQIAMDCLSLVDDIVFGLLSLAINQYRRPEHVVLRTDDLAEQVHSEETSGETESDEDDNEEDNDDDDEEDDDDDDEEEDDEEEDDEEEDMKRKTRKTRMTRMTRRTRTRTRRTGRGERGERGGQDEEDEDDDDEDDDDDEGLDGDDEEETLEGKCKAE